MLSISARCKSTWLARAQVAFNQDGTCLCAADEKGVKIWSVESRSQVFNLDIGAIRCSRN